MAHSGWRVTDQATDQIVNTPGNQTQTGVQVYFVTGDGNTGSIFVPNQQYKAATVHSMVNTAAHLIDGIGKLHNGPED